MVASGMTKARARRVSVRTAVTTKAMCTPVKRAKKESMLTSTGSAAMLITSSTRKRSRIDKVEPEVTKSARLYVDPEGIEGASDTEGVKEEIKPKTTSVVDGRHLQVEGHAEASPAKVEQHRASSLSTEGGRARPTRSSTPIEDRGRNGVVSGTIFSPSYNLPKGYSQEGATSFVSVDLSKASADDQSISLKPAKSAGWHTATSQPSDRPSIVACTSVQRADDSRPANEADIDVSTDNCAPKHQLAGPLDEVVNDSATRADIPASKDSKCTTGEGRGNELPRSDKEATPEVEVAESEPPSTKADISKEKHADDSQALAVVQETQSLECRDEGGDGAHEEDDYDDFDPYLFIKRLPNLADVVSPCRQHLLPKQTRRCPPVTLVLDLDETLVHSTLEYCEDADFTFPVHFNNQLHTVYVRRRPHLDMFMERVARMFEIIVFTASQSVYAEQLLNILDPQRKFIRHRIFRDSCVYVEGNYLKDLSILGRDLAKVAIIDNSPQAFGFQVDNGIPIESWFDDKSDCALEGLLPFLESLAGVEDVRPIIAKRFNLRDRIAAAVEPPGFGFTRSPSRP